SLLPKTLHRYCHFCCTLNCQKLCILIYRLQRVDNDKKEKLLEQIKSFVSMYDYKEFVNQVINLTNENNFDCHQDFILHILKKSINEVPWNKKSKYGSVISTKEKIFNLFNQITDPTILIIIFEFVCQRLTNYKLREKHINEFIQHCEITLRPFIENHSEKLIEIIFDVIVTDKIYIMDEHLLVSLVKNCLIDKKLLQKFLATKTEKNNNIIFIGQILKEEHYPLIIEAYQIGTVTENFLINIHNGMQYDSLEKAIRFQKHIENTTTYRFSDRIEQSNSLEEMAFNKNSKQREFDVKFDLPLLKKHMENIFQYYDVTALSYNDVDSFWETYYKSFDLQKKVSKYAKQLLWRILDADYKEGLKLQIRDLDKVLLQRKLDRLEDIYINLPKKEDLSIELKDYQKVHIESWLIEIKPMIERFLENPESKITSKESRTITTFLNLVSYLKFAGFEEIFLLQLIDFSKYTLFDFDFIDEILGTEKVAFKVLEELKSISDPETKLPFLTYLKSKEIYFDKDQYGIEESIKNSIFTNKYHYARKVVELYYVNDAPFLKSLVGLYLEKDKDYYFLPFILNILVDLNA
ncbi:hypothetical protein, partial [Sphingobacterium siyangense]|uniref:hypothetical protein n=1 Tax=Sphingobacterium siyangense TaxID=459529 RepID=UPI003DA438B1